MDFRFTEQQEMLRKTIRDFMDKECPREKVRKWDNEENVQAVEEVFEKFKGLGVMGIIIPEKYGGSGGNAVDFTIILEEMSRVCWGLACFYVEATIYGGAIIEECGNEEQKQFFLPKIARGEIIFSYGITEPDGGSDAAAAKTMAVQDGDNFIINGSKMFITGANRTDYMVALARTDKSVTKHKGLTLFIIDPKSKGYSAKPLRKLASHLDHTCEVVFDNVVVPKENILGGPEGLNKGWPLLLKTLELEHIQLAAGSIGLLQAAFDDALAYAKQREQFGQPIGKFQAIGHMLAEMAVDLQLAKLITYHCAWMKSEGMPCYKESCMAKLYTTETATKMALRAMEIFGGYSMMMEYDVQRYLRESFVGLIGGGTPQIQKNMIARTLGL